MHKYTQPYTVLPTRFRASACIRCTAAAESSTTPTQYCAMTAKQPSPAAPHTAAHPRPSPCTRIHTHVPRTPDAASRPYSTQVMPASVPKPVLQQARFRRFASCTPAYLHAHASLRVLNMSNLTTILSQQQLRGQSPAHEARLALALLSAPVKARCQKPTLAMRDLVTTRTLLPRYSDWLA